MTLNTLWTKELSNTPKEKKALEDTIYNNSTLLSRLREIIEEKERALYIKSILPSSYKESDWAAQRAHSDGRLYELNELKKLTDHLVNE